MGPKTIELDHYELLRLYNVFYSFISPAKLNGRAGNTR